MAIIKNHELPRTKFAKEPIIDAAIALSAMTNTFVLRVDKPNYDITIQPDGSSSVRHKRFLRSYVDTANYDKDGKLLELTLGEKAKDGRNIKLTEGNTTDKRCERLWKFYNGIGSDLVSLRADPKVSTKLDEFEKAVKSREQALERAAKAEKGPGLRWLQAID